MTAQLIACLQLQRDFRMATPMECSIKIQRGKLLPTFLTFLAFGLWPQAARAEHLCAGRSNEYTVTEVYDQSGGVVEAWCEWGSGSNEGAASMRYFSPQQWKALFDHIEEDKKRDQRERVLMGQRRRQLEQGLWFLPGQTPFADWQSEPGANTGVASNLRGSGCAASYWTLNGAVIMTAFEGSEGTARISYQGYGIPAPEKPKTMKITLTQSGETQTVTAIVSKAGSRGNKMGMVTFNVPSGRALANAIEDVESYSLSDGNGNVYFSGQWHDGLKVRNAMRGCLAKRR
ncbi:MAG: hypothetical protein J0I23_22960 [Rhizobiales bacterium]|nr:hypothetical protein [Hyphomicrobiales bacterium]